ncbi:repressible alkaline phosphatase [Uncinocarpus reesii 1704]|uniref:Alkaline phosphatase n=1 Tax=Uncinocarpus reesii (strain UAMH 1704) TaxID=336963 RepID=C4JJG2_UNCRE|nr:repressible alkaline phosphatase [Uncinocarpus reesii 1704]EEP76920.1 repressible alkaline phosphatase [Uncinocarpus reesii 1704]
MSRNDPLLVQRPSSDHSPERSDAEEDALLTGERTRRSESRRGATFWREVGLFSWALIATAAVIVLAVVYQHGQSTGRREGRWAPGEKPEGKRNLVFMVSDGMGPTSLSMTRSFRQFQKDLPIDDILVLDKHHIGQSRTRSSSSLITDSAAGATAFSCGKKSYNGAISVLPDHSPCGTVLEAAKAAGYMTGLVVTTRITDATPACFSSHVNMRSYEDLIAEHQVGEYPLGRQVDLILGGGRCHFLPNSTSGSCRGDDKDIVQLAKSKGFSYIDNRDGFDELKLGSAAQLPLLGLVAEKDIPFEIDRRFENDVYPSLEEMARTALKALSDATRNSDKGFFIMIEGSRIDHAGHGNDPAAQVHEVLAYDRAFAAVLEFLENDSTPGVLVSTSDHETGGLAAARQLHESYPDYKWFPGVLANASHSSEHLEAKLHDYLDNEGNSASADKKRAYIRREFLEKGLGIFDAQDSEIDRLINPGDQVPAAYVFADIISRRAQIGWATHGHSAADVNIYASSPHDVLDLVGNHENIEVGQFLAKYLDLDLGEITRKLRDTETKPHAASERYAWMGEPLADEVVVDELDTYHGDFKKRSLESKPSHEDAEPRLRLERHSWLTFDSFSQMTDDEFGHHPT